MNSVHSFGLFPRASRFLPQRIAGSGYEIGACIPSIYLNKVLSVFDFKGRPVCLAAGLDSSSKTDDKYSPTKPKRNTHL